MRIDGRVAGRKFFMQIISELIATFQQIGIKLSEQFDSIHLVSAKSMASDVGGNCRTIGERRSQYGGYYR